LHDNPGVSTNDAAEAPWSMIYSTTSGDGGLPVTQERRAVGG